MQDLSKFFNKLPLTYKLIRILLPLPSAFLLIHYRCQAKHNLPLIQILLLFLFSGRKRNTMEFLSLLVLFLSVTGKHCASSLNASRSNNTACDYSFQYRCGDVCLIKLIQLCLCGTKFLSNWDFLRRGQNMNYCCTHPSVKCTKTKYGAFCPFGKVLEAGHFPAYDVDKFKHLQISHINFQPLFVYS